jgi:hypothetical protein
MLAIVTGFAGLAGICAYLITAAEMSHHFSSRSEPRRQALRTAMVTAGFFEAVGLVAFWLAPHAVG